jgi:hypothetical protein
MQFFDACRPRVLDNRFPDQAGQYITLSIRTAETSGALGNCLRHALLLSVSAAGIQLSRLECLDPIRIDESLEAQN